MRPEPSAARSASGVARPLTERALGTRANALRARCPWWTEADAAELAVLVKAFVDGVYVHRERCAVCSVGRAWCHHLVEGLEIILDWRHSRLLRSKARWLRLLEDTKSTDAGRVHVIFDERGEIVEYERAPANGIATAA